MDRSRNRRVLDAIRDRLSDVGRAGLLREAEAGVGLRLGTVWTELSDAGVSDGKRAAIETLAERFERAYPSLLRLQSSSRREGRLLPRTVRNAPGSRDAAGLLHRQFADRRTPGVRHPRVPGGRLTSDLFTHVREGRTSSSAARTATWCSTSPRSVTSSSCRPAPASHRSRA